MSLGFVGGETLAVVGGTYREVCTEPIVNAVRGSGLRAAGVLTSLGDHVALHSCIDDDSRVEAESVRLSLGIAQANWGRRSQPVTFNYQTPVSPANWASSSVGDPLEVTGELIVAFGLVETTWTVSGRRVVIDPQHGDLASMIAATKAKDIAVVLNAQEAMRITELEPAGAGLELLRLGATTVVIKQGALGGLVFSASGVHAYGVIPTERVQPIGSGDAFTAGFGHVWLRDPTQPVEAACQGARVAAGHSLSGLPQVPAQVLGGLPEPLEHMGASKPRIYIAAPFFSLSERMLLEIVRHALLDSGVEVFSPLHDIGHGGDEVADDDLKGLARCDAVLALLDGADPGTVFETGWATKASIPVVGFTEHPTLHEWTMLRGTGAELTHDLATAVYMTIWAAIDNARPRSAP